MGVTVAAVEDVRRRRAGDLRPRDRGQGRAQARLRGPSGLPLLPLTLADAMARRRPESRAAPHRARRRRPRVRSMFDAIAPRYDLVNRLMTFGLDQAWRRGTVAALALPEGALVLDLACGTGDLSRLALRRGYRVVGADLSAGMLGGQPRRRPRSSRPTAAGSPSPTAPSTASSAATPCATSPTSPPPWPSRPGCCAPGGRLAVLEVDAPTSPLWRAGYDVWFTKAVPALGAALSDSEAYHYLPRSVAYLPPAARAARACCSRPGYSAVGIRPLAGGLSQLIVATRAGAPRRRDRARCTPAPCRSSTGPTPCSSTAAPPCSSTAPG